MQKTTLKANLLLLFAAAIWGFAFVAQKKGMDYVGPFTFNAARFFVGVLSLLPVLWFFQKTKSTASIETKQKKIPLKESLVLGFLMFCGISLQQVGLVTATASKAGFLTGTYVLLVPLLGIFVARKVNPIVWLAVIIAMVGLYLLSVKAGTDNIWKMEFGDALILSSAIFWAIHVLLVDRLVHSHDAILLSIMQFVFCALFSLAIALVIETIDLTKVVAAWQSILYVGVLSTGVGFTLQIIAQKEAHPSHSAIIMSMEGVFAVIGGYLWLNEIISGRVLLGCGLMFVAMLLAQMPMKKARQ